MSLENNQEVHFPDQSNFKFLLIKNKDISNIRFDNPEYKKIICNLDIYQEIETSSNDFFENINKYLNLDYFRERNKPFGLNTQVIWSNDKFIYELIQIDLRPDDLPVEIYNGVANILKNDQQHLFGNALMIKTHIPLDKDYVEMTNCTLNDLHDLLENRIRHIGVKIDDDNETEEFNWYYEDPSKFIYEFMTQDHKFVEKAFLMHNLQIYYTPGNKDNMEKLINDKYDQMIILTKKTDEFYENFTLNEFKDILDLLNSECPLECPEEWKIPNKELKEKLDLEKRKFIFNKYKCLYKAKNIYLTN